MFSVETQSTRHRQWFNHSKPVLFLEGFGELCILHLLSYQIVCILDIHVQVVKQQYCFRNTSSSLHIHGRQISSSYYSSVLNLDCWSSDYASTNIIVKLKLVILLNQDSISTVFQQNLDVFIIVLNNLACHTIFVNFTVVFGNLSHSYDETFVTTKIL